MALMLQRLEFMLNLRAVPCPVDFTEFPQQRSVFRLIHITTRIHLPLPKQTQDAACRDGVGFRSRGFAPL